MTAAHRLEALDTAEPLDLCVRADAALSRLVDVLSRETTLLRAGRLKDAAALTAEKTQAAEDYTVLARTVQRQTDRLSEAVPNHLVNLRKRHESLATQMAENLRVLATARSVAEDLLEDVAKTVGAQQSATTYDVKGTAPPPKSTASGLSVNRAL